MKAGGNNFRYSLEIFLLFFIPVQICPELKWLNSPSVRIKQATSGHAYLAAPFAVTEVKVFLSHVHSLYQYKISLVSCTSISCHWPKMEVLQNRSSSILSVLHTVFRVCFWQNVYPSNHRLPCQHLPAVRQTTFWKPPSFMSVPVTMAIAASVWLCKLICLLFYFLSHIDIHTLEINYERGYILK